MNEYLKLFVIVPFNADHFDIMCIYDRCPLKGELVKVGSGDLWSTVNIAKNHVRGHHK